MRRIGRAIQWILAANKRQQLKLGGQRGLATSAAARAQRCAARRARFERTMTTWKLRNHMAKTRLPLSHLQTMAPTWTCKTCSTDRFPSHITRSSSTQISLTDTTPIPQASQMSGNSSDPRYQRASGYQQQQYVPPPGPPFHHPSPPAFINDPAAYCAYLSL